MAATKGSTLVAWVAAVDNSTYLNVIYIYIYMHPLGKTMNVYIYLYYLHYYSCLYIVFLYIT